MPDNPLIRRLITVPTVITLWIVVTAMSPLLALVGATVDVARWLATRKPWVSLRVLAFTWVYLLGEVWALVALAVTAPLGRVAGLGVTYRLQDLWAAWNLRALQSLFSVELDVEGTDSLLPGPVIILSRHASMVDTLLPARLVAKPGGLRLRYVLKKELLADPALDIAGNRLPNAFIDRDSREGAGLVSIRDLAADLGPAEGILIYPEGTRFSEAKLRNHQRRVDEGAVGAAISSFQRVLPPRPGGTLALLEAGNADVVVLAHRGLEGLATVAEIWKGDLVGSTIEVALWRIPRSDVPPTRPDQMEWLHRVWVDVDRWVVSRESPADKA